MIFSYLVYVPVALTGLWWSRRGVWVAILNLNRQPGIMPGAANTQVKLVFEGTRASSWGGK